MLALKLNGGKLGGLPAEVLIGDDQFKPDAGRQLAEKDVKLDKLNFLTGSCSRTSCSRRFRSRSRTR